MKKQKWEKEIEAILEKTDAFNRAFIEKELQNYLLKLFDRLEKLIDWLLSQEDEPSKQHAQELIEKVYEQVCAMESPWYEHAVQTFEARFGHLLKSQNVLGTEE